ncbi:MAG: GNAT family N-acetyltransferase [Thermoplasmata archaeon]
MEIRELTIEDYDAIIELWRESGLSHRPRGRDSRPEMQRQMSLTPELFLGAFEGPDLVGVIIGTDDTRKGWINRLAVHPRHRRKGIGTALLREAERRLRARGNRIIGALIERPNEASEEFFGKLGYEPYDSIVYLSKRDSNEV